MKRKKVSEGNMIMKVKHGVKENMYVETEMRAGRKN